MITTQLLGGGVRIIVSAPAAALFRSLGDPARLAIVRRLALGEARVVDLVAECGPSAVHGLGALGLSARVRARRSIPRGWRSGVS